MRDVCLCECVCGGGFSGCFWSSCWDVLLLKSDDVIPMDGSVMKMAILLFLLNAFSAER